MIKLTEVISMPDSYDSEKRTVNSQYSLRSFYVNPKFIVSMIENKNLESKHGRKPIIKDLIPGARFTKMAVATGVHGTTFYNILGGPEQHMRAIQEDIT